jgi:hypothetical protein
MRYRRKIKPPNVIADIRRNAPYYQPAKRQPIDA